MSKYKVVEDCKVKYVEPLHCECGGERFRKEEEVVLRNIERANWWHEREYLLRRIRYRCVGCGKELSD